MQKNNQQEKFIQSLKIARVSSRFPPTKNCNTQRLSAASVVGTVKKLPQQTLPFFHDHPSARAMTDQRTQKSSPFLESFGLLQILFHLQTLDGAIEGCFGANDVDIAFASVSEALFSALFGASSTVEVDLIGGLCAW